jgi:Rps23 Pro-64 3,4-dihydroxylase Tpa1-like proline 4-hydroxylase
LFGAVTRQLLLELNSARFVDFVQTVCGIDGLIPDPWLFGAGLHQVESGGFLEIHADFNRHPVWNLDRRLNVLFYLNRDWRDEYGGELELWDDTMRHCVRRYPPVANRLVIFSATDRSYHGHPRPLAMPPGRTRKSVAAYYYSNGRPEHEMSASHSTLYQHRIDETERGP